MDRLPEGLFEIIKKLPYDLRAEVVLADLLEKGLDEDVILISPKGLFKRKFSRDLEQLSALDMDKKRKWIVASVNREGIYDALPQAITHSAKRSKTPGVKSSGEMINEIKERRKEEIAARNFFLPFENEFYHQCIDLEVAERSILKGFVSNSRYTRLMTEFWQLPPILNEKQKAIFVYLLPMIHKAAGDLELIKACYEAILNVEVNFVVRYGLEQGIPQTGSDNANSLMLGINFVCGTEFYDDSAYYEITIGPLDGEQLTGYLPGGPGIAVINYLNSFFLPFDVESRFKITTAPTAGGFKLGDPQSALAYAIGI
jgi:hypothetical protein